VVWVGRAAKMEVVAANGAIGIKVAPVTNGSSMSLPHASDEKDEGEEELLPSQLDPEDWELMTEEDYAAKAGCVPPLLGPYNAQVTRDVRNDGGYCI